MYTISIQRRFVAAHAIRLPDGLLEPVHRHEWSVEVAVAGELDAIETVMDFHDLERLLGQVLAPAEGGDLNAFPPFADASGNLVISPTAERVAWWLGEALAPRLPGHVRLESVRVGEAPGCFATWRPAPARGG